MGLLGAPAISGADAAPKSAAGASIGAAAPAGPVLASTEG